MDKTKLVITKEDITLIAEKQIMTTFYIMYHAMSDGDVEGIQLRNLLMKNDYLLIFKAFFCPIDLVNIAPEEVVGTQGERIRNLYVNNVLPLDQQIENGYKATINNVLRLSASSQKGFESNIVLNGFARKLDDVLLEKFTSLNRQTIIQSLYLIQRATEQSIQ